MKQKHIYRLIFFFVMAFALGSLAGKIYSHFISGSQSDQDSAENSQASSVSMTFQNENWGLGFQEEGKQPTGNASMEELKKYNSEDVYVIGGESIYRQLLPYCTKAYVTKIDHAYDADTYFPDLDADPEWEMTKISDEQTYFDLEYVFVIYERR